MRVMLAVGLVSLSVASVCADQSGEALRKEFETYRTASDARIEALEKSAEKEGGEASDSLADRYTKDFEFHGYFRAGLGVNGKGDAMEAFKAPNAATKYRLGNEAEAYLEATYRQNFRTEALIENQIDFFTILTLAYVTPTVNNNDFGTTTSLREVYAGARGIWSERSEALFWAGNRFYEHLDIHITDYFYRDMSGFGGGIEDVALGDQMKWALAWLGGSIDELDSNGSAITNDYNFNKNTIDFRLYDINAGIGELALALNLSEFSGDTLALADGSGSAEIDDSTGWAVGAFLGSPLSANMDNKFTAQYGEGASDNFRAVITAPAGLSVMAGDTVHIDDTRRLRLTDDIIINKGAPLSLQAIVGYEWYDNGNGTTIDWVTLGARPVYHFNDHFSLAFEAGADYTNQDDGPEGVLGKVTLAPQIQPAAEHFSRPSIRAFFTYAAWSDGFEGQVANISYGNEQHGISAGVQMEAWW